MLDNHSLDDGAASGLRRATLAGRRATQIADGYAGLPEGVTRWRLAAALRAAASAMGLSGPMLRLLEHYIDLTYDQDWAADSEPVVTRPLIEIADHLGRSERQVRNIERALVEKGLLAWRDSGNHHRKGRRDRHTGRLVYAYGPSLAPLGARADEILARAQAARAEIAAARRLRIAISALRRRIRAALAAADEASARASLAARFAALPDRHPAGLDLTVLAGRRDALIVLAADAEALLGPLSASPHATNDGASKTAGLPEKTLFHKTDTSKKDAINGVGIPCEQEKSPALTPTRATAHGNPSGGVQSVPLALALAAAGPELSQILTRLGAPTWRTLSEAAQELAPMLGVNAALWGEACGRLGRSGAALAILLLERGVMRRPDEAVAPIRRPDSYLRAMIARADDGELHLDRSVRAWAQRTHNQG